METYIITMSLSGGGMEDFDFSNPDSADEMARKALEAVGGNLLHAWATLGRFDVFAVVEVPNATAVRAFVACLPGHIKTETQRAFPGSIAGSDYLECVKKVQAAMG